MSDMESEVLDRIASALERCATIQEKRFQKEFPEAKVKRDAELIRADEAAEQYSDKPTRQWFEEAPKEAEPSRFAKRLNQPLPSGGAPATEAHGAP